MFLLSFREAPVLAIRVRARAITCADTPAMRAGRGLSPEGAGYHLRGVSCRRCRLQIPRAWLVMVRRLVQMTRRVAVLARRATVRALQPECYGRSNASDPSDPRGCAVHDGRARRATLDVAHPVLEKTRNDRASERDARKGCHSGGRLRHREP